MAELSSSVFLADPDSHEQIVLAAGSTPEPRLARLVTNPSAWVGGVLPDLGPVPDPDGNAEQEGAAPVGDGAAGTGPLAEPGPAPVTEGGAEETAAAEEQAVESAAEEAPAAEEQPEAEAEAKPAARRGRKTATAE